MHTVSVKTEQIKKYNIMIKGTYLPQVGRMLQLPLAKQVTVAGPDRVYPLLQL